MNAPRDWTLLCLSCGAVVALSRLFSLYTSVPCTWVPGYLGTWVPGYLGTWVPGYLGTWVPGYLGTWVPGKTHTFLFAKTRTLFCDNTYTFCVRVIANRKKKYTCYRNLPFFFFFFFFNLALGSTFFCSTSNWTGQGGYVYNAHERRLVRAKRGPKVLQSVHVPV